MKKHRAVMDANNEKAESLKDDYEEINFKNNSIRKQAYYLRTHAFSRVYKANDI